MVQLSQCNDTFRFFCLPAHRLSIVTLTRVWAPKVKNELPRREEGGVGEKGLKQMTLS